VTIPAGTIPDAGLDDVDRLFDAATVVRGVPDVIGEAVRADKAVADHITTADTQGKLDARQLVAPLRAGAIPAAEAAAAPYVERLRANDAALASGALAARYGSRDLARKVHDVDDARLRAEMAAAVGEAIAPLRARLDELETNYQQIVGAADELPTPAPEALESLKVLMGLLPNLSPAIAVAELERAVGAAARNADARGNLRYLLPVTRSLAERPEYGETSDAGIGLRVVIRRAEALARDRRHVGAESFGRYAGRLRYELGVLEAAVGRAGSWSGSHASRFTDAAGGGPLKALIVPPPRE
jgi:hypothetical protein